MRVVSEALAIILASGKFQMADLYEITLISGTVLRYTTADSDLVFDGDTYSARGPQISRSQVSWKIGVEVDSLNMEVYPKLTHLVEGSPWPVAVRYGLFDSAKVRVTRLFMATFGDTTPGGILMFWGEVADVEVSGLVVAISVNSFMHRLNTKLPKNLYQAGCKNTLYDVNCGAVKASFQESLYVGAGATVSIVPIPGSAQSDGWYDMGVVEFTTGACSGLRRTVKKWMDGAASFSLPLPVAPSTSDAVTLVAGDDKTYATCGSKFSRTVAFRGEPFVPVPTTAV